MNETRDKLEDSKNPVRPLAVTAAGKTIGWRVREGGSGLMEFAFVEGGQLPPELQGDWTSIRAMKAVAESYVILRGEMDRVNGKKGKNA